MNMGAEVRSAFFLNAEVDASAPVPVNMDADVKLPAISTVLNVFPEVENCNVFASPRHVSKVPPVLVNMVEPVDFGRFALPCPGAAAVNVAPTDFGRFALPCCDKATQTEVCFETSVVAAAATVIRLLRLAVWNTAFDAVGTATFPHLSGGAAAAKVFTAAERPWNGSDEAAGLAFEQCSVDIGTRPVVHAPDLGPIPPYPENF